MKVCLLPLYILMLFCSQAFAQEETTTTTVIVPADAKTTIVTPAPAPVSAPVTTTVVTGTPTTTTRIITPVPSAKETVVIPTGYVNCTSVAGAWVNNVWVPDHKICHYENSPEGKTWVSGYWGCDDYNLTSGECIHWSWSPSRWE